MMTVEAPRLYRHAEIGSTQDTLHALAAEGAPAGTAVLAAVQTGGRGSRGRAWRSPAGGLWLSVLYRPAEPATAEVLSLRIGLAAAAVLESIGLERVRLKWPNDLMLGERKTGGILCEGHWQGEHPTWIAAGIGLNVTNPLPLDVRTVATALAEHAGDLTVERVLDPLLPALRAVARVEGPLDPAELETFARRDWLRGRTLREPVPGVAEGIAADGALRVRGAEGRAVMVHSGSVVLRS